MEEHEEKPHRSPTTSIIAAQVPRSPRVAVEPIESGQLARTCRRAAMSTARLAQHVRAERVSPLRL